MFRNTLKQAFFPKHYFSKNPCENLRKAAANGDLQYVLNFIAAHKNEPDLINDQDIRGYSAIFVAAENNQPSIVKALVDAGAYVEPRIYKNGRTPLYIAAKKGHLAVAEELIAARANVNVNASGYSPLMATAMFGHSEVASKLITAGADIHASFMCDYSAFYLAAKYNHSSVAKVLADAGANVHRCDWDDNSPLSFAIYHDNKMIADLIRQDSRLHATTTKQTHSQRYAHGKKVKRPHSHAHTLFYPPTLPFSKSDLTIMQLNALPKPSTTLPETPKRVDKEILVGEGYTASMRR